MGLTWVIGYLGWVMGLMAHLFGSMFGKGGRSSAHTSNSKWGMAHSFGFWLDHWCGDRPLREMFPLVYCTVRQKDTLVADYLDWQSGVPH